MKKNVNRKFNKSVPKIGLAQKLCMWYDKFGKCTMPYTRVMVEIKTQNNVVQHI